MRRQLLSYRQWQVLELISLGNSNAQIGQQLFLSEATAKTMVGRLLRKLEARNRAHVVRRGYELGLLVKDGDA